jgi:hypothetical protein
MGKRHRRIRAPSATGQVAGAATEKPGLQRAHRPRTGLPSLRSPRKPLSRSADHMVRTGRQLPGVIFISREAEARLALISAYALRDERVSQTTFGRRPLGTTDENQVSAGLFGRSLREFGVGVGDDELKRRVWDRCPAALLAALTA